MTRLMKTRLLAAASIFASAAMLPASASAVDLEFYFPVAVGGDAAGIIEGMTSAYMEENPGVTINAIYTGSYADTTTRAITAARGGNPPQLAILLSVDMFALIDEDIILPWDDFVTEEEQENWIGGFYDSFMRNSQTGGQTWGIPFQRSTPVMYYNKEAFAAAGLDPETPPATWDEMVEMGRELTLRDDSGNVTQWGVRIPSSGFPSWLFTGLVASNGQDGLANDAGTEVYFDTPEVIGALEYLVSLADEHEIMAPGILDWGATPRAFMDGESAIAWTTTGNLTNIRSNAPFDFGVAMLPANVRRGAPTGGGNFYLFEGSSDEQLQAAVDFVKWATAPEQAASWSIDTGYVAPRPDTWETDAMRAYAEEVPGALVARDQLEFAVPELSTFEGPRITQIINDAIAAAIVGDMTPADAMADAQSQADAILAAYR
ncbi:MAG: sn-glycerol 3-phosphate transport system substrate-binding protein [Saliniramus fredricksonii]|uniref:Carbohydrate ABC transporter substrate-binding protein, CUT1 family n=1 Tax=Saliniramus fredricksonii TaxID=1653334 RepID=A0A0P7X955_9HYPH|nr:ABC transporter substrate-binding protein [Saliniramus fredricksonii]KPQ11755.1 MAG: sn-glycerol 3-phosphate transport system substrate-binding protein [Saliniramus fredricksonii]SCC82319.1 carbohydrate ABC transporter substrate-binding protein, CUT1 family [Saliniramus fredricksonii]